MVISGSSGALAIFGGIGGIAIAASFLTPVIGWCAGAFAVLGVMHTWLDRKG